MNSLMVGAPRTAARMLTLAGALVSHACSDAVVGPKELSAVSVEVTVSGADRDTDFLVALDGGQPQMISPAAGFVFREIPSGRHSVTLAALAANCSIEGDNPQLVEARSAESASVSFHVRCTATTGVITAVVQVSGSWNPYWFRIRVDSEAFKWIRADEPTVLGAYPGGFHAVTLDGIPESCRLESPSRVLALKTGEFVKDTIEVRYELTCEMDPAWAADESTIVFQRGDSIAVVRDDGSNLALIAAGAGPSWSRNEEFFAFHRPDCLSEWFCSTELWTFSFAGPGTRRILTGTSFFDSDAAVSPDGKSIAFMRFWSGPDQTYLAVTRLDDESTVILAIWDAISTPDWSPDGKRVAFTCEPQGFLADGTDICTVNAQETCTSYFVNVCGVPRPQRLASTRWSESEPSWSPDGTSIAFTLMCQAQPCPPGVTERTHYVALLDPVTQTFQTLVPGSSPDWSPDGTRIVFVGNEDSPGLSVVRRDGTGFMKLTGGLRDSGPSWK